MVNTKISSRTTVTATIQKQQWNRIPFINLLRLFAGALHSKYGFSPTNRKPYRLVNSKRSSNWVKLSIALGNFPRIDSFWWRLRFISWKLWKVLFSVDYIQVTVKLWALIVRWFCKFYGFNYSQRFLMDCEYHFLFSWFWSHPKELSSFYTVHNWSE